MRKMALLKRHQMPVSKQCRQLIELAKLLSKEPQFQAIGRWARQRKAEGKLPMRAEGNVSPEPKAPMPSPKPDRKIAPDV